MSSPVLPGAARRLPQLPPPPAAGGGGGDQDPGMPQPSDIVDSDGELFGVAMLRDFFFTIAAVLALNRGPVAPESQLKHGLESTGFFMTEHVVSSYTSMLVREGPQGAPHARLGPELAVRAPTHLMLLSHFVWQATAVPRALVLARRRFQLEILPRMPDAAWSRQAMPAVARYFLLCCDDAVESFCHLGRRSGWYQQFPASFDELGSSAFNRAFPGEQDSVLARVSPSPSDAGSEGDEGYDTDVDNMMNEAEDESSDGF